MSDGVAGIGRVSGAQPGSLMWTPTARAKLTRELLSYATSLNDAEWALVDPLVFAPAATGRSWRWILREVMDAILYVLRNGCACPSGAVRRQRWRCANDHAARSCLSAGRAAPARADVLCCSLQRFSR